MNYTTITIDPLLGVVSDDATSRGSLHEEGGGLVSKTTPAERNQTTSRTVLCVLWRIDC